jgi:hypothetical protein
MRKIPAVLAMIPFPLSPDFESLEKSTALPNIHGNDKFVAAFTPSANRPTAI